MCSKMLDILLSGVDFVKFSDTGGQECLEFMGYTRRFIETVVSFTIFVYLIFTGFEVRNMQLKNCFCYHVRSMPDESI